MNAEMWNNSINQKNVSKLMEMGVEFIGPEYGHLSCDEVGLGRLSNAKKIQGILIQNLKSRLRFLVFKILCGSRLYICEGVKDQPP